MVLLQNHGHAGLDPDSSSLGAFPENSITELGGWYNDFFAVMQFLILTSLFFLPSSDVKYKNHFL